MSEWPTARGMELVKYEKLGSDFLLTVEIDLKQSLLSWLFGKKPTTMAIVFRGDWSVWHYYPSGRRAPLNIDWSLADFRKWIAWEGKDFDTKYDN